MNLLRQQADFRVHVSSSLLRPGVVSLLLLLVAALGWAGGRGVLPLGLPTVLVLILGAGALLLTFLDMEWGLLLLFLGSLLVGFELGTGTQSPIVITTLGIAALLVIWLLRMLRSGKVRLLPSAVNWPAAGLMAAAAASFLLAQILRDPAVPVPAGGLRVQLGALALFVLLPGLLLLTASSIRRPAFIERLTHLTILSGGVAIVSYFLGLPWFTPGMVAHVVMWVLVLAFGQLLCNPSLPPVGRLVYGLVVVLWFLFYLSPSQVGWVSGWLPPAVAMLTVAFLRSRRLFLVLLLGGVVLVALQSDVVYEHTVSVAQRTGSFLRFPLWAANIELGLKNPLTGVGPGNPRAYLSLYLPEYVRTAYANLGWRLPQEPLSHNDYIDTFTQTGLLGLGFLVAVQVGVARAGLRLRRRFQPGFWQGFIYSCLGGLAGVVMGCWLGSWFLPYVYNGGLVSIRHAYLSWLYFGALVALERLAPSIVREQR